MMPFAGESNDSPAHTDGHARSSADGPPYPRGRTAKVPNGDAAPATAVNGKATNGAPVMHAMHAVPNGRPVPASADRGAMASDRGAMAGDMAGHGRSSKGRSEDQHAPTRSSEGRGSTSDPSSRDDGYFASVYSSSEQHAAFGSTRVTLSAINANAGDSRKETLRDVRDVRDVRAPADTSSELHGASDASLNVPNSAYRVSSPAAFNHTSPAPSQHPHRLQQRHTLEVPKASALSRPRDPHASQNSTDDVVTASGRFSPNTNTPTRRRGSMSLARRATRSIHSDMHLEEPPPQDEDAARWAEHIRQKRASKRKRREDEDEDRVVVGTKVDQNHVNWVTAYNMLTGIRFCVSRTNAKMDRQLTDADFEAKNKFSFDITGNELTPSAKYDFKFKDYAPWVFRHLRSGFGLDPADYLVSLTSKYILSELGSPGKSGSFFYFSRDYKYIIKTIHHAEHKFLRKILRDYYNHVQENPNTLLSQFYGLHRVKIPYGRKIHFVVMNNLFPPHRDIHRTFDLKGSTIGREFKEEDLETNPRATLKDLNWLRRNLHLEFGPTKKEAFIAQMLRDVKLLQKLHIMDYSLLVGIHDLERGNEENLRDKTLQVFQPGGDGADEPGPLLRTPSKLESARKAKELRQIIKTQKPVPMDQTTSKMPDELLDPKRNFYFYKDDGGFRATHEDDSPGEEIYYLGIIDCLTHYSLIKRMEHFFKGLMNPETQISAIPPERYGDRFVKFISNLTKTREAAEREKQEEALNVASDAQLSGVNATVEPEKVVDMTERQAERTYQRGGSEENIPDRGIHPAGSPSTEGNEHHTTLPVVEETAESSSTGGRSERSTESSIQSPTWPLNERNTQTLATRSRDPSHNRPPPTPPKDFGATHIGDRPPTPPKDNPYVIRNSGPPTPPKEDRGRGSLDKQLPVVPPMETFVRVN